MVEYRVSELAKLLNISDVAIRKRIKHGEFDTVKEEYNNRIITFIRLTEKQVKKLGLNKKAENKQLTKIEVNSSNNDELKELILECTKKYEDFYSEYATRIDYLNQQNALLTVENTKLKAQLATVITKYNTLAKRINANIAKKNILI